jgi:hypothetical protein
MAHQHYLPATYIGNFSAKETGSNRKRKVWVKRRKRGTVKELAAQSVGYAVDIYGKDLDDSWNYTEDNLKSAIDALINSDKEPLTYEMWDVMISFLTQTCVRGPEFNQRFEQRIVELAGIPIGINIDLARRIEMQRLAVLFMYADWTVAHHSAGIPLITNDLGYVPMKDPYKDRLGYTFPLSKNSALAVTFGERIEKRIAPIEFKGDAWVVCDLEHNYMTDQGVSSLNEAISQFCIKEIYGASPADVAFDLAEKSYRGMGHQADYLLPPNYGSYLRDCENDRLILKIELGKMPKGPNSAPKT